MTTDGRSAYALAGPEELREIIERYRGKAITKVCMN